MNQREAIGLIRLEKEIIEKTFDFPNQNKAIVLNAIAKNNISEKFLIDINRKRAILSRCTFQKRVRTSIPLIRLDIDTKPHRNPDHKLIEGNHIHIYREGFDLGWAYPLDHEIIKQLNPDFDINLLKDTTTHTNTFINFCSLCNITKIPIFQIPAINS